MIATARRPSRFNWQRGFLVLLPAIRRFARLAFRRLDPVDREESVAEAVATALVAYRRLVQQGRQEIAYATPLAKYAVLHVRGGRHVGGRQSSTDALSRLAQRRHGFQVMSLHQPDSDGTEWVATAVAENRHATPAEVAATRIDFRAWLSTLPPRRRCIARALASGETTNAAAQRFAITPGRISQMRRELDQSWRCFQAQAAELERAPRSKGRLTAA